MKVEKREGRRRFSAPDAVVAIVLAAVLIGGIVWAVPRRESGAPCFIRYVLRIYGADPVLLGEGEERIFVGASVRTENGTAELGRVESVVTLPQRTPCVKDGKIAFSELPDVRILEVTVTAEGRYRAGDGIRVSDVRISAGSTGSFRLGRYYAEHASVILAEIEEGTE